MIIVERCGCDDCKWVVTDRVEGKATLECLNCRTVMTVDVNHEMEMHKNVGKPLPESKDAEKFYAAITKANTEDILDKTAGQKVKCFCCEVEGAVTGKLAPTKLKIVGMRQGEKNPVGEDIECLVCEMCLAFLATSVIVQCGNTNCGHWEFQDRKDYIEQNRLKFVYPEIIEEFQKADVVFSPHWTCSKCSGEEKSIQLGWRI